MPRVGGNGHIHFGEVAPLKEDKKGRVRLGGEHAEADVVPDHGF